MASMPIQQALTEATALFNAGKLPEAERLCRQVIAVQPNHPDALNLLGMLAFRAGLFPPAAELFSKAAAARPDSADFQVNLGSALDNMGRLDDAVASFRRAIALQPDLAQAHTNLGIALVKLGQPDQAIPSFTEAIRLNPQNPNAYYDLGNTYQAMGRDEQSLEPFRKALELRPDWPEALNNLGLSLSHLRRWDEAIQNYRRALELSPDRAEILSNLGDTFCLTRELDQAITCFTQALRIEPNLHGAMGGLCTALRNNGQIADTLAAYDSAIKLRPRDWQLASTRVYTLTLHPDFDSQAQLREQRAWATRYTLPIQRRTHTPRRDGPVRIGYVSADFRDHVVGRNVLPLLRLRDRRRFQIFCYTSVPRPDAITLQFRELADEWRDIQVLDDESAAELVRRDGIDVLVDLSLHTPGSQLRMMAHKPAPLQVTFAAYPGGTGLDTIDWRLTDPYLDPPGETDADYVEKSFRLPDSFWCYDTQAMECRVDEEPALLPALANGVITFGCLNNFCKVNNIVLDLWGRAMAAVPSSRLILMAPQSSARQRVLNRLASHGVTADQIEFVGYQRRLDYLALFNRIDVCLDTLPYNGHTTSLDALWMGVPTITRVGRTVVGRAGLSQLSNLKLTEFIARSDDQFVSIADEWAGNLPKLADLRRGLRRRMLDSPLMDSPGFAQNVESAYQKMWEEIQS
jgi:protein O-GlcNAc transferase